MGNRGVDPFFSDWGGGGGAKVRKLKFFGALPAQSCIIKFCAHRMCMFSSIFM